MKEFQVKDCTLLLMMSNLSPAVNLRELRDRVAAAPESVLYHHFFETRLRPTFDDPFYRNDFAVWANIRLRDPLLAERLGIIDPYAFGPIEELRAAVLEIIDDRLAEAFFLPWSGPGQEFFFMEARTVIFDTGERLQQPKDLAPAIRRMSSGSVYYHFLEARRRPRNGQDDFTSWLSEEGKHAKYLEAIGSIDFYFHSLPQIREALATAIERVEETP